MKKNNKYFININKNIYGGGIKDILIMIKRLKMKIQP